ncbi:PilN domain-containing protein [Rubellicoccus peritrichatus]|uniref:PilN domain-containing protein n=1 Tax=Rubellicoccus peritrichatus TaxID=3080537 RepID=A0AAQ3QUK9_9BACT|nr:PilN domain-containing protein [Puniceicoccus sp. CR14]WOO40035.1 PilN domain-containing protein [Puniceicoccus sp. CR14]
MKLSDLIKPSEEAAHNEKDDAHVCFVDGYCFFSRIVAIPEGLERDEWDSFTELSLEELSPFPIEQLAWGSVVDDESQAIFVYAACRPRIPAESQELWPEAHNVFPVFLPLLLKKRERPCAMGIVTESGVTLLRFSGKGRFPEQVVGAPLVKEEDEDKPDPSAVLAVADKLKARLRLPDDADDEGIFEIVRSSASKGKIDFELRLFGDQSEAAESLSFAEDDVIWRADIREPDFIDSERKRRISESRLGWVMAGVGIAAALMLLVNFLTFFGDWLVNRRQALVEGQSEAAFAVQQNSDFLYELEQFSGAPFRPFSILEIANRVLLERQPRKIEFDSASVSNTDEVAIQGVSDNVDEVNQYSNLLRQSGYFNQVDLVDVRTRQGKVNFTINLRFNPDVALEVESDVSVVAEEVESQPEAAVVMNESEVADE